MPRSLFNRPMSALRRDASKLVKLKHHALLKPFKPAPLSAANRPMLDMSHDQPDWLIHEDWALLQVRHVRGIFHSDLVFYDLGSVLRVWLISCHRLYLGGGDCGFLLVIPPPSLCNLIYVPVARDNPFARVQLQ